MNLKKLDIHPNLRGYIGQDGESLPGDLVGATIVQIGCVGELENGFVIDYLPPNCRRVCRIVICSTELGMWIEGKCTL